MAHDLPPPLPALDASRAPTPASVSALPGLDASPASGAVSALPALDASPAPASVSALPAPPALPHGVRPSEFERAFAALEAEIRAVPEEQLLHITVDVRRVTVDTLARLPRLTALRASLAEELPRFDLDALDRLETYALAALHAYLRHQATAAPPAALAPLAAQVAARRTLLLADVQAYVAHGLIDGARLQALAGPVGYSRLAWDVLLLRSLLVDAWPRLAGSRLLLASDLEDAATLATQLLEAVATKNVAPRGPSETARLRDQAFTLFATQYERVRRAVAYVRAAANDADAYAPSLYTTHRARKRRERSLADAPHAPAPEATALTATAPATASAATTAALASAATAPVTTATATAAAASAATATASAAAPLARAVTDPIPPPAPAAPRRRFRHPRSRVRIALPTPSLPLASDAMDPGASPDPTPGVSAGVSPDADIGASTVASPVASEVEHTAAPPEASTA